MRVTIKPMSWQVSLAGVLVFIVAGPFIHGIGQADDAPITRNVPIPKFQNPDDARPYDFDATPQGLFLSIQFAEGFEDEIGFRRSNEIVPVNPTDTFRPDSSVYVIFRLHQHLESFQVFGLCYPEQVADLDPTTLLVQDTMLIALEDDTGYIKLDNPSGGWKPGRYRVEIHVGWRVNEISLMGTMRFTVEPVDRTG